MSVKNRFPSSYPIWVIHLLCQLCEPNLGIQKSVITGRKEAGLDSNLTPKENEILPWLATGKSNKEIAKVLRKSDQAVKVQARELMRKLEVSSR